MDRQIKHNLTGQPGYDWGMTDKPFLTIGEVADILQVSSRTVYNLIYKGTLRVIKEDTTMEQLQHFCEVCKER